MLDIGDTSLGITALLALAWQRTQDPRVPEAVRRSLAFHLRERVYTQDNPGYPNLRVRNSYLPYARYVLEAGAHPIGDWPSTVWALLQRSTSSTRRTGSWTVRSATISSSWHTATGAG